MQFPFLPCYPFLSSETMSQGQESSGADLGLGQLWGLGLMVLLSLASNSTLPRGRHSSLL